MHNCFNQVELLVTPSMPDDFCRKLAHEAAACDDKPPCRWRGGAGRGGGGGLGERTRAAGKGEGHCGGSFGGWICWPGTAGAHGAAPGRPWRCMEPPDDDGDRGAWDGARAPTDGAFRARRRGGRGRARRRGRRRDADGGAEDESPLALSVSPMSEAFALSGSRRGLGVALEGEGSLELTYSQEGVYRTRSLRRADFHPTTNASKLRAVVGGVRNLRRVEHIAVCLNGGGSAGAAPDRGCVCNETSGVDERLGRRCKALRGGAPAREPVDFIVPRRPETLSAMQQDLGMAPGVGAVAPGAAPGVPGLVVVQFSDETFSQRDVAEMKRSYGLAAAAERVPVFGPGRAKVVDDDTAGEGSMDIQIAAILAPDAGPGFWSVGPYFLDGFFLAWAVQVNDHPDPPLVHSISWGDAEPSFPETFVRRLDYEVMKMALRGITVLGKIHLGSVQRGSLVFERDPVVHELLGEENCCL